MKVKRFIASDMKSAMAQVRQSLGAEAVILSNRMVTDGVEILASNDYVDTEPMQESPVLNRPYRTYGEIHDDMPRHSTMSEEKVSLSRGGMTDNATMDKSSSAIFDQRERLTDTVDRSTAKYSKAKKPAATTKKADYSEFIVDEDDAVASSVQTESTNQETEHLRQELQSLRSMMETQIDMMHWDKQKKHNPVKTGLLKRLSELGLTVDISKQVLDKVKNITDASMASKEAIKTLINMIPVATDDILKRQGVVALVGPTGVGKTTTIAKLAARFVMANQSSQLAMVTLDNYRIGAQEQLFNYARILGVSVHNARDSNELHKVLQNLYDKKLVLIDTAGMSHKDLRICEQFNMLKQGSEEVRSYVVLAANAQTSALDETVNAFKQTDVAGCILTKLDESASLGGAISMLIRHQMPLSYCADGQAVPEDLHVAYGRELVAEALDLLKNHAEPVHETDLASAFNNGQNHAH